MPYGINPAPEVFQEKLCQSLDGLNGIHVIADNVLITGRGNAFQESITDYDNNMRAFLQRCREMKITLSKGQYKLDSISSFGRILMPSRLKSDPAEVSCFEHAKTNFTDRYGQVSCKVRSSLIRCN